MLKALTTLAALAASLLVFAGLAQAAAPADRPDPAAVAATLVGSPAAQVYVVTLRPQGRPEPP